MSHPAGAACSISTMRRWDGTAWRGVAGAPTECHALHDVAAGAPGAREGAWIAGNNERDAPGTWSYDGGAWTYHDDPLIDSLSAISYRDERMWAVGAGHKIVAWRDKAWIQEW
jgi:hypothetical protein